MKKKSRANKPELFTLELAPCGSCDFHWPEASLVNPIQDYYERVEEGEEEPDGECPITGTLSYLESREVPVVWRRVVQAVTDLNASGRALAAFLEFPRRKPVTIRIWSAPHSDYDETTGILADLLVRPTEESASAAVLALNARRDAPATVAQPA